MIPVIPVIPVRKTGGATRSSTIRERIERGLGARIAHLVFEEFPTNAPRGLRGGQTERVHVELLETVALGIIGFAPSDVGTNRRACSRGRASRAVRAASVAERLDAGQRFGRFAHGENADDHGDG